MRETLRKFENRFSDVNVALLTAHEIQEWLTELKSRRDQDEGLAVKTRNRHLTYVQNIFNLAKGWGLLDRNPLDEEAYNKFRRKVRTQVRRVAKEALVVPTHDPHQPSPAPTCLGVPFSAPVVMDLTNTDQASA